MNRSIPDDKLDAMRHGHRFDTGNQAGERSTLWVMWITAAMMLAEIGAGWFYNSMALLADGFHMSSHAVAIGLSAFAYSAARRHSGDWRFAFGTWKIEILGGFASAVFLLVVVALMVVGSVERLVSPQPIHYFEAIVIAVLGLVVNIVCAVLLGSAHHHGGDGHSDHGHGHHHGNGHTHEHGHGQKRQHEHGHQHDHGNAHQDLNLRSAYVHVVTDAATSVLAILALAGGWAFGWNWLDPAAGIVGAVVVALWARRLISDTAKVLLDREMDAPVVDDIRGAVAAGVADGHTEITDLHVWRVGKGSYACALTLITRDRGLSPDTVRNWLGKHEEVVHSTIEIHHWPDPAAG